MSSKKAAQTKWHHHHLVARVRYALYGPGYSSSDVFWATIIKVSRDWRQPRSALLSLPAEIRNQIFSYLSKEIVISTDLTSITYSKAPLRALLMTCRQMFLDLGNYPLNINYRIGHFASTTPPT